MKPARALLFTLALSCSVTAFAQYQWTDKNGRRVFSDRPPPAGTSATNVTRQPRLGSGSPAAPVQATAAAAPAVATASATVPQAGASKPAGVDKALEDKKREAEAAEAAAKAAEEKKLAAIRADNCKRAMNAKTGLDAGGRIARTNDKGEREVLNDEQRAAERKRLEQVIAENCR